MSKNRCFGINLTRTEPSVDQVLSPLNLLLILVDILLPSDASGFAGALGSERAPPGAAGELPRWGLCRLYGGLAGD